MVVYEVTAAGPEDYQVTVVDPEGRGAVVGEFVTEAEAEAFATHMRQIDAGPTGKTPTVRAPG